MNDQFKNISSGTMDSPTSNQIILVAHREMMDQMTDSIEDVFGDGVHPYELPVQEVHEDLNFDRPPPKILRKFKNNRKKMNIVTEMGSMPVQNSPSVEANASLPPMPVLTQISSLPGSNSNGRILPVVYLKMTQNQTVVPIVSRSGNLIPALAPKLSMAPSMSPPTLTGGQHQTYVTIQGGGMHSFTPTMVTSSPTTSQPPSLSISREQTAPSFSQQQVLMGPCETYVTTQTGPTTQYVGPPQYVKIQTPIMSKSSATGNISSPSQQPQLVGLRTPVYGSSAALSPTHSAAQSQSRVLLGVQAAASSTSSYVPMSSSPATSVGKSSFTYQIYKTKTTTSLDSSQVTYSAVPSLISTSQPKMVFSTLPTTQKLTSIPNGVSSPVLPTSSMTDTDKVAFLINSQKGDRQMPLSAASVSNSNDTILTHSQILPSNFISISENSGEAFSNQDAGQATKVNNLLLPLSVAVGNRAPGSAQGFVNLTIANGHIHSNPNEGGSSEATVSTASDYTILTPVSEEKTPGNDPIREDSLIVRRETIEVKPPNIEMKSMSGNRSNTSKPTTFEIKKSDGSDVTRKSQELNKCLQEALEAFEARNRPLSLYCDEDEVTLTKLSPTANDNPPPPLRFTICVDESDDVKIELVKTDTEPENTIIQPLKAEEPERPEVGPSSKPVPKSPRLVMQNKPPILRKASVKSKSLIKNSPGVQSPPGLTSVLMKPAGSPSSSKPSTGSPKTTASILKPKSSKPTSDKTSSEITKLSSGSDSSAPKSSALSDTGATSSAGSSVSKPNSESDPSSSKPKSTQDSNISKRKPELNPSASKAKSTADSNTSKRKAEPDSNASKPISGSESTTSKSKPESNPKTPTPNESDSSAAKQKSTSDSSAAKSKSTPDSSAAKQKSKSDSSAAKPKSTPDSSAAKPKSTPDSSAAKQKSTSDSSAAKPKSTPDSSAAKQKSTSDSSAAKPKSMLDSSATKQKSTPDSNISKRKLETDSGVSKQKSTTDSNTPKRKPDLDSSASKPKSASDSNTSKQKPDLDSSASKPKSTSDSTASKLKSATDPSSPKTNLSSDSGSPKPNPSSENEPDSPDLLTACSDNSGPPVPGLEWKDGIAALPMSSLKFRVNEFGLVDVLSDEEGDEERKSTDNDVLSPEGREALLHDDESNSSFDSKSFIKKEFRNDGEGTDEESDQKPENTFYCCRNCNVYGLPSEFLNPKFCTQACSAAFTVKRASQYKREQDLRALRLRRKKRRLEQQQEKAKEKAEQDTTVKSEPPTSTTTPTTTEEEPAAKKSALELELSEAIDEMTDHKFPEEDNSFSTAEPSTEVEPQLSTEIVSAVEPKNDTEPDDPPPNLNLSEDDAASVHSNDDAKKIVKPKQTVGFTWCKYLEMIKAKAAPAKLFKEGSPYTKNCFKIGMKLEGVDPEHQSHFCVLSVAEVRGYRLKLHFDGYAENYDFWVNADSPEIFPPGWCEKNNRRLHLPKGFSQANFHWSSYMKQCKATAAPRYLFSKSAASPVCPSGFRVGMKLEAVDRKNSSLICVATVADVLDNRILIHFDSWDEQYDYWADPSSPYIFPAGWCNRNGRKLTLPNNWKGTGPFNWATYIKESKSTVAPPRAFKQRQPSGFRKGMRIEAVDKRVPHLIRVATIDEVNGHRLRIRFDGWPDIYSYWIDDDSPDIHPPGWCRETKHPLEPPLSAELAKLPGKCGTLGCDGLGHTKGPKFLQHNTAANCPYAPENLDKEGFLPDRLYRDEPAEFNSFDDNTSDASPNHSSIPFRKPSKLIPNEIISKRRRLLSIEADNSNKKRRKLSDDEMLNADSASLARIKAERLQIELEKSVLDPGYEIEVGPGRPACWAKHSLPLQSCSVLTQTTSPKTWKSADVARYVSSISGLEDKSKIFADEDIDGEALLLLTQNELVSNLGLKLGPAIKLYNCIVLLRQKCL